MEDERNHRDLEGIVDELDERAPEPLEDVGSIKMRGIFIDPLNYGFIVKIGCQKFAIETKERLIEKLTEYINNPQDVERKWMRSKEV